MIETGRTVVITGASSGFGAAAVRAFADRGDRIWGTMQDTAGRNAAKKAELEGYSPRIAIVEMDVTNDTSVADGFAPISLWPTQSPANAPRGPLSGSPGASTK
jgi:NAD(P)-dependent dehydrogenase (short-subunit alcohol dehydrogenase family)